jgi:hypothetical protein
MEREERNVTIKRRGKMVAIAGTLTKLVDECFGWKDPKAAERAGISMIDYVIGGMDRGFRLKLFYICCTQQRRQIFLLASPAHSAMITFGRSIAASRQL